jgi:hypothetical protein
MMMRIETFKPATETIRSANNGLLSMLTNTQMSQSKEKSTLIGDSMLREISMLFQN